MYSALLRDDSVMLCISCIAFALSKVPSCAQVCSGAGTCHLDAASCDCFAGYAGSFCERCAPGFAREPHTSLCLPQQNECAAATPVLAPAPSTAVLAAPPLPAVAAGGAYGVAGYGDPGYGYGELGRSSPAEGPGFDVAGRGSADLAAGPSQAPHPIAARDDQLNGAHGNSRPSEGMPAAAPMPDAAHARAPGGAAGQPEMPALSPSAPPAGYGNAANAFESEAAQLSPGSDADGVLTGDAPAPGGYGTPQQAFTVSNDSKLVARAPFNEPPERLCYYDEHCPDGGICVGNVCACSSRHSGDACAPHCAFNTDGAAAAPSPAGNAQCDCCVSGVFDVSRQCCDWSAKRRPTLDSQGTCCAAGYLDACGRCAGTAESWGFAVDRDGTCCEVRHPSAFSEQVPSLACDALVADRSKVQMLMSATTLALLALAECLLSTATLHMLVSSRLPK